MFTYCATILTCFHASSFPFRPLCRPPLFLPFSGILFALFSPSTSALFCRAKLQRAQHGAWRGEVSGWTSPQSSGRKFLPEICVKKGQYCAIVAPQNPERHGEVPGNQLFMGTLALPFGNYCVTIAQLLSPFP